MYKLFFSIISAITQKTIVCSVLIFITWYKCAISNTTEGWRSFRWDLVPFFNKGTFFFLKVPGIPTIDYDFQLMP